MAFRGSSQEDVTEPLTGKGAAAGRRHVELVKSRTSNDEATATVEEIDSGDGCAEVDRNRRAWKEKMLSADVPENTDDADDADDVSGQICVRLPVNCV